ncbi:MAG: hypothetical protein AABX34_01575, partial [Nanoarchaeota archaeon]
KVHDKIERAFGIRSSYDEMSELHKKMPVHPARVALGTLFIYSLAGKLDEGLEIIKKMKRLTTEMMDKIS